ncbi:hypothetical protein ScPMuIL_000967 [Solemya velum]
MDEKPAVATERRAPKVIRQVHYGVEDVPAPHLCFLFGFQQAAVCIGGTLSVPFILASTLCADGREDVTSQLLGITLFMCGVATLLQTTIGVRLPIIQGGSHTFIAPIIAMMLLDQWKCSNIEIDPTTNRTDPDAWQARMREVQGNLMLASLTQVVVGCSGLAGFFLRFVGPLTIAPTISLIGLSLIEVVELFCQPQWGISIMSATLIVIFSIVLYRVTIPFPAYSREKGCYIINFHFFGLFSIILALGLSWLFCFILTETDSLTTNSTLPSYNARTDSKGSIISSAPWFDFPLPLPFGTPTFSAAGYVGMLAATLSSIIESIGDYFASARISGAPPPPPSALNRGIAIEGASSIISGLVGAGHGTTSYSENIGEIAITKVGSRRAFQAAALIMIFCGIFSKIGAVLASIPDPVIGGSLIVDFGLVISIGISSLQFCDMSSLRNLTIIGVSFMMGLMIPDWLKKHPAKIDSGYEEFDQVVRVLGGTASFVGGFIGFLLDNLLPGTEEERGIKKWLVDGLGDHSADGGDNIRPSDVYDIPFVMGCLRKIKCCSYIPFSPTFDESITRCRCCEKNEGEIECQVYQQDTDDNEQWGNLDTKKKQKQETILSTECNGSCELTQLCVTP